jgi:DNA-binding PadR family transcriptional regulator
MSQEQQTVPPGTLLVNYILADAGSPMTFGQIQSTFADACGQQLDDSTLWRILERMEQNGRLKTEQLQLNDGSLSRRYELV